jgi:hypothetical protein
LHLTKMIGGVDLITCVLFDPLQENLIEANLSSHSLFTTFLGDKLYLLCLKFVCLP